MLIRPNTNTYKKSYTSMKFKKINIIYYKFIIGAHKEIKIYFHKIIIYNKTTQSLLKNTTRDSNPRV